MASPIIQLPERDRDSIQLLIELTAENKESILKALGETDSSLHSQDFVSLIAEKTGMPYKKLKGLLSVLFNLYNVLDSIDFSPSELSQVFANSLKQYDWIDDYDEGAIEDTKKFIKKCLGYHSTLGVTAKALGIMTQHNNVYRESKLYTDIRPIFKSSSDVGNPEAAVIVHNLKIDYYEEGDRKTMHLALDNSDIENLIKTLERAQSKYEFLAEFLENSDLRLLKE